MAGNPNSLHPQAKASIPTNRGTWAATTCSPAGAMCFEDTAAVGPVMGEGTALWVRQERDLGRCGRRGEEMLTLTAVIITFHTCAWGKAFSIWRNV